MIGAAGTLCEFIDAIGYKPMELRLQCHQFQSVGLSGLQGCYFPLGENRRHSRGLGWGAPVSGRRFPVFRSVRGGFRTPVSARHFPISISAERRLVRLLTETGSRSVFRATPPGVYSLDRLFCPGVT